MSTFNNIEGNYYLNTGMYIGYSGYINVLLKDMKKFINKKNLNSNQMLWRDYLKKNPDAMYLDKKNEFFRNIYNNRAINNIINNKYNTPFIISCPTLTLTNVDFKKLLTHYNYNITPLYTDINWLIRKIFYIQIEIKNL